MHNGDLGDDLGVDKSFKDLTCDVVSALAKYHRLLDERRRAPPEEEENGPYFKSASTAYGTFSRPFLKLPFSQSRLRSPISRDSSTQTAKETTQLITIQKPEPLEEVEELKWESPGRGEERISADAEVQTTPLRDGCESHEESVVKEERLVSLECSSIESNDEAELTSLEASVLQEHDLLVAAGLMVGEKEKR